MRPSSSNSRKALATELWLGMVSMRIQRPRMRIWFTRVERLRAAAHLHHRQGFALGGAHGAHAERDPVDLAFQDAGHGAVALGRGPHHAFAPGGELAQLGHFGVGVGRAVGLGQAGGVEDARLGAHGLQQAGGFQREQLAVGALAQRAVQQEDARCVGRGRCRAQPLGRGHLEAGARPPASSAAWDQAFGCLPGHDHFAVFFGEPALLCVGQDVQHGLRRAAEPGAFGRDHHRAVHQDGVGWPSAR